MKRTPLTRKTRLKAKTKLKARRIAKRFAARRDPAYADWIRQMVCLVCCGRPAEAAHVRSRGAGGDDRGNLVPLCHQHHAEQHRIGIRSFADRYDINLVGTAANLGAVYQKGGDVWR